MSDDDLLHALAAEARREKEEELALLDERWDRLAAGGLAPAEEAELRALAEGSAAGRAAHEAFRPLGGEFRQQVARAIRAQAESEAAAAAEAAAAETAKSDIQIAQTAAAGMAGPLPEAESWDEPGPGAQRRPAVPPPSGRPPRTLPFRPRPRWAAALAVAAALAAAVTVWVRVQTPAAPLPEYATAEVSGGDAAWRGGPEASGAAAGASLPLQLHAGSYLEVEARPRTAVSGPVEARLFAARSGEAPRKLTPAKHEVWESGAVHLKGIVGRDLDLAPGAWSLWLIVGRPGEPRDAAVLRSPDAATPGWTLRQRTWTAWRVAGLQVGGQGAEP